MRIGLIQVDGKLPNLALMKLSYYYKSLGATVEFAKPNVKYDKVYAAVLFSWNREKSMQLHAQYENVEIGGTGIDLVKTLPPEIHRCPPDYNLYTIEMVYERIRSGIRSQEASILKAKEIISMGTGFTSRGCDRFCPFCVVPIKEGCLRQENSISELINPLSNLVTFYDNNMSHDPYCLDKLQEIRDRDLTIDISQGIDIRDISDELAYGFSTVRHMRQLHYAWDLMAFEQQVLNGIRTLTKYIKTWRQKCFVIVGFNTTFEEDMYRVKTLMDLGVTPYVMKYNNQEDDIRLNHFARWVNGFFFKICTFDAYDPWVKAQQRPWRMDDLFQECC